MRALAVVLLVIAFGSGCSSGSQLTSPSPEECERSLDEFEETRRKETLEARQNLIALQKTLREQPRTSRDEIRAKLRDIKADMDAAVQQVGCE